MLQTNVVEAVITHVLHSINISRKSCNLGDEMEMYGTVGLTTGYRIIRCMCCTCWINKATDTHSEYVIQVYSK